MAINLSARDFLNKQFVELLMHTPADYGVDNGLLELEITERTIANKESALLKTLEKLHNHGFSLAIDDFGTGYSSMSYLKKMPIDLLKIDQSFIKDIPDDQEDCVITEAIINLGKNLSVSVLAEGVERQEQLDFLNKMECDYIQGYLFAKPLDPEAFANKLNRLKQ